MNFNNSRASFQFFFFSNHKSSNNLTSFIPPTPLTLTGPFSCVVFSEIQRDKKCQILVYVFVCECVCVCSFIHSSYLWPFRANKNNN